MGYRGEQLNKLKWKLKRQFTFLRLWPDPRTGTVTTAKDALG